MIGGILGSAVVSRGLRHGDITGLTRIDEMPPGRDAEIAFAAVWAQARWGHGRGPTQCELCRVLDGPGRGDAAVLSAAGGISSGVGITPVLERCRGSVARLAAQLYRESSMRHSDVCSPRSADRADRADRPLMIRSGCAPGTFTVVRASSA